MPAPVQIAGSPFQTDWTATTATKTCGGGFSVGVGDLIVAEAANEDGGGGTVGTPSNSGTATITWTARGSCVVGSHCFAAGWTGSVTGAGTVTVSATETAGKVWGMVVYAFAAANHGGVGQVPAGVTGAASVPSLSAAWSANSFVACINGDWTATAIGGARAYLTNLGAATESNYTNLDSTYTTDAWYHADSGAGGNVAVGMSTPNQTWSLIAVEVKGTVGGPVLAPRRMPFGM